MLHFSKDDITKLEQRKRTTFINSLNGFKNPCLIGSIDNNGKTNLSIFNSITHIGANPPLVGLVVRPDSVDRHTLLNILETKYYTINHVNSNIIKNAHQTSARYEKEISEFDACGLTPEYKNNFSAPFVKECNIKTGLVLKEKIDIKINGTILLIGEIEHVFVPENSISLDGFVDAEKTNSVCSLGLDGYYSTKKIMRLSYAKPNKELEEID